MTAELDEISRDALAEILNIGVGRAAASLSEMVADEVLLDVPTVEVIDHEQANRLIDHLSGGRVTAITQDFSGDFDGKALLFFPQQSSMNLVRTLLKDDVPLNMLSDLEKEALLEVGNIILNACFGTVANILSVSIESSLPQLIHGRSEDLLGTENTLLLLININFRVDEKSISGYVSFVMDVGNYNRFHGHLRHYIKSMMGS
jgi:chemotaxis protein CheC